MRAYIFPNASISWMCSRWTWCSIFHSWSRLDSTTEMLDYLEPIIYFSSSLVRRSWVCWWTFCMPLASWFRVSGLALHILRCHGSPLLSWNSSSILGFLTWTLRCSPGTSGSPASRKRTGHSITIIKLYTDTIPKLIKICHLLNFLWVSEYRFI